MRILGVLAALLLITVPAVAQTEEDAGAVVSGAVSATAIDSRTELTFSGGAGYRFNRYVGLEIEVTSVPTLKAAFPNPNNDVTIQPLAGVVPSNAPAVLTGIVVPPPTYSNLNGDVTIFTTNIRLEMPMPVGRITPYFAGGGGVAEVRHSADVTIPIGIYTAVVGALIPQPAIRTITEHVRSASTALALTLGGGVSVQVASHVSVDIDLRYFRLLSDTSTNAGRFGAGARYRF